MHQDSIRLALWNATRLVHSNGTNGTDDGMSDHSMDDIKDWLIISLVFDFIVVVVNLIELKILVSKWSKLERIEHILLSLCISDLFSGMFMLVQDSQIMHQVMKHNMHNNSRIESLVLDSLFIFTVLSTVLHVTVISIERLVAVAFPIKYNSFTTLGCKIFSLLFMWLAPLLLAPLFTYLQVYGIDQKYKYGNIIRPTILFVCCFIVFFGYMFLVIALLRRDWRLKQMIPREVRKATRDRRTTLICLFIGLAFVCCVIPYALGNVSIELYNPFFNLLITLNHGINPLLYFLKAWLDKRRRGPSHSSSPNIPDIQALVSTRSERTLSNITSSTSCIEKRAINSPRRH